MVSYHFGRFQDFNQGNRSNAIIVSRQSAKNLISKSNRDHDYNPIEFCDKTKNYLFQKKDVNNYQKETYKNNYYPTDVKMWISRIITIGLGVFFGQLLFLFFLFISLRMFSGVID